MPRYAWEASLSTDLAEGFALRQWNVAIHGEKPFFRGEAKQGCRSSGSNDDGITDSSESDFDLSYKRVPDWWLTGTFEENSVRFDLFSQIRRLRNRKHGEKLSTWLLNERLQRLPGQKPKKDPNYPMVLDKCPPTRAKTCLCFLLCAVPKIFLFLL